MNTKLQLGYIYTVYLIDIVESFIYVFHNFQL